MSPQNHGFLGCLAVNFLCAVNFHYLLSSVTSRPWVLGCLAVNFHYYLSAVNFHYFLSAVTPRPWVLGCLAVNFFCCKHSLLAVCFHPKTMGLGVSCCHFDYFLSAVNFHYLLSVVTSRPWVLGCLPVNFVCCKLSLLAVWCHSKTMGFGVSCC